VYPLIPITVSYFGGQAKKSDNIKSTFTLAIFYVLGMALTYSLLGTVAALTGQMLGAALQNPIVLGFIAIILVALAASMFGAFEIQVPQSLASIGGKSRQGVVGSLFMGLTVGIIAAPCIGPFVLSLLIFVGDLGNPWLGFVMFFTLSLGLGVPYLLLGTFSGLIKKLPRSGQWMVWVRYVFGFILIGMAIYFLEPVLSDTMYRVLFGLDALAAAIFLGVITWKKTDTKAFKVVKPVTGVLFLAIGLWISAPAQSETEGIQWTKYSEEHLQEAAQTNTPVIIDFYADWCLPCKELDKFTFTDSEVKREAQGFVTLKADLTQNNSPEVQQLKDEYDIRGVPTIVFLNAGGEEIQSLRLTGYESADKFLQRMNQVTGNHNEQLSENILQEMNE
jgi:thiol:disulfide interchange protein DsbD